MSHRYIYEVARFSKAKWPQHGPVRELLSYLEVLHTAAGMPSMSEIGRAVALARSTVASFFNGTRLIGRGNLELVVEHLGGDVTHAEALRRRAIAAWGAPTDQQDGDAYDPLPAVNHASPPGRGDQPHPPFSWPHRVGVVPLLVDGYQTRSIAVELDPSAAEKVAKVRVLSGLGGVGKTQLAAAFADRRWTRQAVDLLMWVAAVNRQAVVAAYAQAAAEVLGGGDSDIERAAARLLAWLAGTDKRWLVVLDDVQTPSDLTGLWPPSNAVGTVVVTTRRRDAALHTGRRLVEVGVFAPNEATAFLTHRLPAVRTRQAGRLACDLGYLPLALAQAAAYMLDRGLDCRTYRQRLANQQKTLADLVPEPQALPDQQQASIDAAWSLSLAAADELQPRGLARPLMNLVALLDPNGIPAAMMSTEAVAGYLASVHGMPVDADASLDALHNLHRLNLVTLDANQTQVRIHALVQRASRDRLAPECLQTAARWAADALLELWPDPDPDPARGQTLFANTIALRQHTDDALLHRCVHQLLLRAGDHLGQSGQLSGALLHYQQLINHCDRVIGPDHPNTLTARHELAFWRGQAGDLAGATDELEQVLTDQRRVLGANHPDTLSTCHDLANFRGYLGDLASAAETLEQVLADELRILGPNHAHTLTTRHSIASWKGRSGDATGAAAATAKLLADQTRILGPDHPNTIATHHWLAHWRGEAGDPAGAIAELEKVVVNRVRVLGPTNPRTLASQHEIAVWIGRAGDPTGAAEALERVLADQLRALGPYHPDTLATRNQLARWRGAAGDSFGALAAFNDLLRVQTQALGPDHPDTRVGW